MPKKILIHYRRAPGDGVAITGMIRDVKLTYGDEFQIGMMSKFDDLYAHNPNITPMSRRDPGINFWPNPSYKKGISLAGQGKKVHFMAFYHEMFRAQFGVEVPVHYPYPDLHLTEQEKTQRPIDGRYWVVMAGSKDEINLKHWRTKNYQALVDMLGEHGIKFVQCGAVKPGHVHPPLQRVLNLVGWGNLRAFMRLIYHADGVIGPVTAAMHIAAAFQKPYVCIAGGREEPWWISYNGEWGAFGPEASKRFRVPHRVLHTLGDLDCCKAKGCWKQKVIRDRSTSNTCYRPIHEPDQSIAECMDMITPDTVARAALSYYVEGTLPPPEAQAELKLVDTMFRGRQEPQSRANITMPRLQPESRAPAPKNIEIMDHPEIGGKFTVCTVLYGGNPEKGEDFHPMIFRTLESIVKTLPAEYMDLRIGANRISQETKDYIKTLGATRLYVYDENRYKYPLMREMFWDQGCPITTNYVVWFDDDSTVRHPHWAPLLAENIINNSKFNVGCYGEKMLSPLRERHNRGWFTEAPWHTGKPFHTRQGKEAPNGNRVVFCVGGFWCIKTEAIRKCNIPDPRLVHIGGDVTIGEQLHQQGYRLHQFNSNKSLIITSGSPRRGFSHPFPWDPSYTTPAPNQG